MAVQKFIIFVLLSSVPQAFSFWTACPNGRPPIDVFTDRCTPSGCTAIRGEPILMKVKLDFLETHQNLRPRATTFVLGIPIQIPDLIDTVCPAITLNGNGHGCPVHPNVEYEWTIDMIVPTTMPAFNNGRVRVELLDGTRVVSCFEAHGNIV